jgi:hypothetical protein
VEAGGWFLKQIRLCYTNLDFFPEKFKGERLEINNWAEDSSEEEYDEESLLDGEE